MEMTSEKALTTLVALPKEQEDELYSKVGKRIFEAFLLILMAPPLMIVIPLIYITLFIPNRGRVIFRQERIGMNGRPFSIYKFRTLKCPIDIDIEKNPVIIKRNSHRIGFFLRKTGLDEILQIINVIKGEMTLIGPRPLIVKDLRHLTTQQFTERHKIKPGILGLWQVRRKYSDDKNYLRYDSFYYKKQSLSIDMFIVLSTLVYMVKRKGR